MASSKEYLNYIMEQLSDLDDISCRAMMGEYIIYYRKKIIGGIYDDRLLVKNIPAVKRIMPYAVEEVPYKGAKPMLLVEDADNKMLLKELFTEMFYELPAPKK